MAHKQRTEDKVHKDVGHKVEDGAGGTDPDHEPADTRRIPGTRHAQELLVHVIPGNRQAAAVINQVEQNQLDAHHGQKRQQGRRGKHAKHVAEVRARGHLDVLDHVSVGLTPLDDALLEHHQVLLEQNNVRRLLGNVDSGIDRDSDIGRLHGRGIVDAVTHIAHNMPVVAQNGDDTRLLVGRELGKHLHVLGAAGELRIIHGGNIAAQQHVVDLQPHLLADGTRDLLVVSGQNLGGDAMIAQCLDSIGRRLFGRIQKRQIAD